MPLIGLLENDVAEERISELEGMTTETFTTEKPREQEWKKKPKTKNRIYRNCGTTKKKNVNQIMTLSY